MNLCNRGAVVVEYFTREMSLQYHLRAIWEYEAVEEAGAAGCPVESEFLQRGRSDAFAGRSGWWLGGVFETNLDKLK